jgi:phospholipid/cholesterol/gamma-HCH transport system substrate-binding protein
MSRRRIREQRAPIAAIFGLLVAALLVGGYIIAHQNVPLPGQRAYRISAEFSSAQAVTPGQGQSVTVAGVRVGLITKVRLNDGVAVVTMRIRRGDLPAVHRDASFVLRPATPLEDESVAIDPGTPGSATVADGAVFTASRTTPEVHLDEVLAGLDADTRQYLLVLVTQLGRGLDDHGTGLRRLLKASAPTLGDVQAVTSALRSRDRQIAGLVTNLRTLAEALARPDTRTAALVRDSARTFSVLAGQERELGSALTQLPGTLAAARRTLARAQPFSRQLTPALRALRPAVRNLPAALAALPPFLGNGTTALRRISTLAVAAQPVLRDVRPALRDLRTVTPELTQSFDVLRYVANELAHNPEGPEEGFLFWLAWMVHNGNSMLSTGDANGAVWHGLLVGSCSSIADLASIPVLKLVLNLPVCPSQVTSR